MGKGGKDRKVEINDQERWGVKKYEYSGGGWVMIRNEARLSL